MNEPSKGRAIILLAGLKLFEKTLLAGKNNCSNKQTYYKIRYQQFPLYKLFEQNYCEHCQKIYSLPFCGVPVMQHFQTHKKRVSIPLPITGYFIKTFMESRHSKILELSKNFKIE